MPRSTGTNSRSVSECARLAAALDRRRDLRTRASLERSLTTPRHKLASIAQFNRSWPGGGRTMRPDFLQIPKKCVLWVETISFDTSAPSRSARRHLQREPQPILYERVECLPLFAGFQLGEGNDLFIHVQNRSHTR